MKLLSCSS